MKLFTIDWFINNKNWWTKDNENIVLKNHLKNVGNFLTHKKQDINEDSIPFATKDNICIKDITTSAGSNILEGYKPSFNATVIDELEKNGFSSIYKTTLDELGMGGTGLTSNQGYLHSPWDYKRIAGGSSSGSALSVALGLVPFALGSDTGDSVRKPAAYNGLYGFKPSWGKISRWGLLPYAPTLDTISWFANTISDIKKVMNIINVHDVKDGSMCSEISLDKNNRLKDKTKKLKIGVINNLFDSVENKQMKKSFDLFLKELKSSNSYEVINLDFDLMLIEYIGSVYSVISFTESLSNNFNLGAIHFGKSNNGNGFADTVMHNRNQGFGDLVKARFTLAALALSENHQNDFYIKAKKGRTMIKKEYQRIFNQVDCIFYPAAPDIPPLIETIDSLSLKPDSNTINAFASGANLCGHPSISIPLGYVQNNQHNFPFSIMVDGKWGDDENLLNLAQQLENKIKFENSVHKEIIENEVK